MQPTADRVVDHIEHVVEIAGIDAVGLGPDFIDDYYQQVFGGWIPADASVLVLKPIPVIPDCHG